MKQTILLFLFLSACVSPDLIKQRELREMSRKAGRICMVDMTNEFQCNKSIDCIDKSLLANTCYQNKREKILNNIPVIESECYTYYVSAKGACK